MIKKITLLLLLLCLSACATYQSKVSKSRSLIQNGQVEEALPELEKLASEVGKDQLIYVLDYATALQMAGKYRESSQMFIKADKLVDLNDYHSVSGILGATLGGEEMVQYKGESFEKFMINNMNAINFIMMGDFDAAMVEVRRINEKINKMKMDGREPYEQSPFARYLAGLLWEADRKFDDAYIEYEASYKLDAANPFIAEDLLRISKLSRRDDAYKKWKKEFPEVKEENTKGLGEIVVILQQGWGPVKKPNSSDPTFPILTPSYSNTHSVKVTIDNKEIKQTQLVYDVQKVAIDTLRKDYGALIARRVGGKVAKAVVADQFRQKDSVLGAVAWIAMNVADRADVRQWSTLPESFQLARFWLPPGEHKVQMMALDSSGQAISEGTELKVTVKAGQKAFVNYRPVR